MDWELPCGWVMPQHHVVDSGRRVHAPVLFHPNGAVKTLPLQSRTPINVGEEIIPAELLTFYESGHVRRVFPSSGKLSGFWTEEQEAAVTPILTIAAGIGIITAKIINAEYFPSGILSSVTLWPNETTELQTNIGIIYARKGISFFENGCLQSYEPASPVEVETPIGMLTAYDSNAIGISGDRNSLSFNRLGAVESLTTMNCTITVQANEHEAQEFGPYRVQSYCSDGDTDLIGLRVFFPDGKLIIGKKNAKCFELAETTIAIEKKSYVPLAAHC
jgi:hypothetical protein